MGDSRITIDMVGGHGCGRGSERPQSGEGSPFTIDRCHEPGCIDCLATDFVAALSNRGITSVKRAQLEHWPKEMLREDGTLGDRGGEPGPIDNLQNSTRNRPF